MISVEKLLNNNGIQLSGYLQGQNQYWQGSLDYVSFDEAGIKAKLLNLDKACYILRSEGKIGITNEGYLSPFDNGKKARWKC